MIRTALKNAETGGNDLSYLLKDSNKFDNLLRYEGGGGTLRMDFKDVQFGDLAWEDYVSIDPDRTYGINPAEISVYELKKFGAYAEDGMTTRMFYNGSAYCDQYVNAAPSGDARLETELYAGNPEYPALLAACGSENASGAGNQQERPIVRLESSTTNTLCPMPLAA